MKDLEPGRRRKSGRQTGPPRRSALPRFPIFLALVALHVTGLELASAQEPQPREPFFEARKHPSDYHGPGRDEEPPKDLQEVRIGYFGPSSPEHPEGGDPWLAANLALEEENGAGGYRGLPFRLLASWSENPWGTGISQVARMVYVDRVWALIGSIDGPSTHLAEQVVAKARLTLINPGSWDETANLANVPWIFSVLPGHQDQAPILVAALRDSVGKAPFALISATDHDSRVFGAELKRLFSRRGMAPRYHFELTERQPPPSGILQEITRTGCAAVVIAAGAGESARVLKELRHLSFEGLVFGGPAMGRWIFVQEAGTDAEGVVFPLLFDPSAADRFCAAFEARFGRAPDYVTAHTYDSVKLLIAAIRTAGLNRARIRDSVRELSPWSGVTGRIHWDLLGQNQRPVTLGTIRNGRIEALH